MAKSMSINRYISMCLCIVTFKKRETKAAQCTHTHTAHFHEYSNTNRSSWQCCQSRNFYFAVRKVRLCSLLVLKKKQIEQTETHPIEYFINHSHSVTLNVSAVDNHSIGCRQLQKRTTHTPTDTHTMSLMQTADLVHTIQYLPLFVLRQVQSTRMKISAQRERGREGESEWENPNPMRIINICIQFETIR